MATGQDLIKPGLEKETGHAGVTIVPWSSLTDSIEQTPELMWPVNVAVFDLMRRSDAQVAAINRAWMYPIRRLNWHIDPQGARPEVVTYISEQLNLPIKGQDHAPPTRRRGRFSWAKHLRLAMLDKIFGHMFFEQQYDIITRPAGAYGRQGSNTLWADMGKLAPRFPATISEIKAAADGGLEYIKQHGTGQPGEIMGSTPPINVDRLVAYVNEQEGVNWFGLSILRQIYKHWLIKDRLLRVDAMRHEKTGVGQPIIEAPVNVTKPQMEALDALAQKYAASMGGGAIPSGSRLRLVGVEGSMSDVLGSIKYHDEQMAKLMLLQFLQLGTTEHGVRALADSFIDFFDLAIETIANDYAEIGTEHVIEDLIDLNYSEDEPAPAIGWARQNNDLSTTELTALLDKGAVTMDDETEAWVRESNNMPKRTTPRPEPTPPPPGTAPPTQAGRHPFGRPGASAAKIRLASGRDARRELYPHEVMAKTDFPAVDVRWEAAATDLVSAWAQAKKQQIASLVEQITKAAAANDLKALAEIAAPILGADFIEEYMRAQVEWSVDTAVAEAAAQGFVVPKPNLGDFEAGIADRATATATLLAKGLSESAGREAVRLNAEIVDGADVAALVLDHLESLSDAHLRLVLGGCLTTAQNMGRLGVFAEAEAGINQTRAGRTTMAAADLAAPAQMAIYASELLDDNTCPACYGIDGTYFDSVAEAQTEYSTGGYNECDGGERCRGTLVGVYGEAGMKLPEPPVKPPFDELKGPPSIKDVEQLDAKGLKAVENHLAGARDRAKGDQFLYDLADERGFTASPTVVSESEMDDLIASGKQELMRGADRVEVPADNRYGYELKPADELLREGDYYAGQGIWGNGTYTAYPGRRTLRAAEMFADAVTPTESEIVQAFCSNFAGRNGTIARMTLSDDAVIGRSDELIVEQEAFLKDLRAEQKAAFRDGRYSEYQPLEVAATQLADLGRYAAYRGYDAYYAVHTGDEVGEMIVLNRSKLIVQDTHLPPLFQS